MKISLTEHSEQFHFHLTPETLEDASLLTRMAMNSTKRAPGVYAYAGDKTINGGVSIGKRHDARTRIRNIREAA